MTTPETAKPAAAPMDDLHELRLDGRGALILGGAGGIGRAVAALLGRRGARVMLLDTSEAALSAAAGELAGLGVHAETRVGDAGDSSVSDDAVAACVEAGGLEILVNCAGIGGGSGPVIEMSDEAWREVIDVNLTGAFYACRAAARHMAANGYGRIVNIASIAGLEGNPNAAHYSASKGGLITLTKSLGKELAQSGVLVNAVAPAVIETPILDQVAPEHVEYMRSKIPMGRFGTPEEVARLVAFLVSDHVSFSTGVVYDLSGGRAVY